MKNILLTLLSCFCIGSLAQAQSLSVLYDTVYIHTTVDTDVVNPYTNVTSSVFFADWQVVSTDFPLAWQGVTGMCDPTNCYTFPDMTAPPVVHSSTANTGANIFRFTCLLSSVVPGCYYVTIRINKQGTLSDSVNQTYIVCKPWPASVGSLAAPEVAIYPNPASSVLHLQLPSFIDRIVITDMTGRLVSSMPAMNSVDVRSLSSGSYIIQLIDAGGAVRQRSRFNRL